ncbi:MAG TPA: tetratricopeptide repeat protein [Cyclobacteriaceae bacterium]|jgi:tetratricopeptide (TPR) repeat protein|nr:tetratricopeptide repeat protein [Cyclobacteriaceae bacterium]
MLKTRIILIAASALVVWLIFLLPKAVVENEHQLKSTDSTGAKGDGHTDHPQQAHTAAPAAIVSLIKEVKKAFQNSSDKKNAIFADSLRSLYTQAGQFDSAAWFGEKAATFFNNTESFLKAGNSFYQAYTFAMDAGKQKLLAEKTREYLGKAVESNPKNYEARIKMAMTYLTTGGPMQGIRQLRDVLSEDPKNELALFNMGMLSVQSGQNKKAIDWLKQLVVVNPTHTQGQMLLGVAYMNDGQNKEAREQFEKVKKMEKDPAVQATVDSYLKDLK